MSYDNTNRGALFINDKKTTDQHPDFTGKLNVGGKEYFLDAWKQPGKNGKKGFMSVRVKEKGGIQSKRDEFDM